MDSQIEPNGIEPDKRKPDPALPARVLEATKVARAIHLCASGYDLTTIADEIGFASTREVKAIIINGLREMQFDAVEEYKAVELNRLDRITRRLFTIIEPYAANGADPSEYPVDNQAMNAMALYLKVSERRAKYTGMETTRVEVTGGGEGTEPIKVQIVEDVERFQRFITERVIEMQNNAPQMIAAEVVGNDPLDQADGDNDFNLAQLRGTDRGEGSGSSQPEPNRSDEIDGGGMGARRWSDSRGSTGGGRETTNPALLSPDSVREAG